MSLTSELISQFVKATNDTPQKVTETTVHGTTVLYNGKPYVKIDGSDLLTPVNTTSTVNDGDRVTILIKNHTATVTGNTTDPSASSTTVKKQDSKISEFEIVMAYKVTTEDLEAINATIQNLVAKTANIQNADIIKANIEQLQAKYASLEYVNADEINTLKADIEHLEAEFAKVGDLSAEELEAITAEITNLKGYTADFTYVSADVLSAFRANIKELEVQKLSAKEADLKYAKIDFANIGEAAIKAFYAKSGVIRDIVIDDGHVTGTLVGVTIKGDLIEGGTVIADKLVIKGEDGLYYKLNTNGEKVETAQTEYNSLNGSIITAHSVTAEKIRVEDLVAFDATIGGFHIGENSIYSDVKSDVNNTTRGIYLDNTGQFAFGDSNNYLKFYQDSDKSWKLVLSASSIMMSSHNKTVETIVDEINDRISNAETSISNNSNEINLRATTEDVTEISNKTNEMDKALEDAKALIQENREAIATLTSRDFKVEFTTITNQIHALNGDLSSYKEEVGNWMRFDADGNLVLGATRVAGQDAYELKLTKNRISFMLNDIEVAYISSNQLYITNSTVVQNLKIGGFTWEVRGNGNLGLVWR